MSIADPGPHHKIDLATWERTELFRLFSGFTEPYHGVCLRLDCTEAFAFAKANQLSVFLTFVHCALTAAHRVENFHHRIVDGEPWRYERIDGGCAVGRPNGTIGFAHYQFSENILEFAPRASAEVERVKNRTDLERYPHTNVIRFSTLPWLDFTSLSHARNFAVEDAAPRITFGKMTEAEGRRTMPVSIHVHHALVDGLHLAHFADELQKRLADPGAAV